MKKRVLLGILIISLLVNGFPGTAFADNDQSDMDSSLSDEQDDHDDESGIIDSSSAVVAETVKTVDDVIGQLKFSQNAGHGFAAERGNTLVDRIKGNNARVIGDNNVKNGADRIIIGRDGTETLVQTKYYNTASKSIDACFENDVFRYFDSDGNPIQIEVPSDQYDSAVKAMENKIRNGNVPGVTDPNEAKSLVRKGHLTYDQAKNLAKAGTVESLTYDAVNGVVAAGGAFGISVVLNYASMRYSGVSKEEALKTSAKEGLKTGAKVFATSIIAGQLAKTGVVDIFKPSSEALTKALGKEFSEKLLKAYGQEVLATSGKTAAESATKQAAKLLRTQVLVGIVTVAVFSVPDGIDVFRGRISKTQFIKNFAVTAASVVIGGVGAGVGGAVGGTVVPGAGAVPGSIIGSLVGGIGGGIIADKIADKIASDDAEKMYVILQDVFARKCEDYLLNDEEAADVADKLSGSLTNDMFKDMYGSENRELFAEELLIPMFEETVAKREYISSPTEEEMRYTLLEELDGAVFIH